MSAIGAKADIQAPARSTPRKVGIGQLSPERFWLWCIASLGWDMCQMTWGSVSMAAGDNYRAKALELLAKAEVETNPTIKADFENLAAAFLRLAKQAERNADLTIEFHLPPEQDGKTKH